MDIHEAVQLVTKLYHDTGKIPVRHEAQVAGLTEWHMKKLGWKNILSSAGLDSKNISSIKKIDNSIFEKDIFEHVENYAPVDFKSPKTNSKILVVGDLHFPWVYKKGLELLYEFNKTEQPDYIIQVGDAYDMYAFSKFPRSQNIYSPKEEEQLGREGLELFWRRMRLDNSKAKCVMLHGNHDIRPIKRTLEHGGTFEHIVEKHLKEIMTFEGVETVYDYREEYEIEGILFHHGFLSGLGQHRDATLRNFVAGHTHKGGVSYRRIRSEVLWELNAGFLGDPEAKVFSYTALKKNNNYTLGWGFIDKYGPRFIHI